ncbi:MAG: hypothetical protein JSW58_05625 [Candidatus Latescibacterota bacterium]|nr:MAG: hypothetical protein JSW58_05625 [Candidatus Latescibacterota bacterium]
MPTRRRRMGTDPLTWVAEDGVSEISSDTPAPPSPVFEEVDVLRLRDRPLSQFIADYFICRRCGTVGRGAEHATGDIECPGCRQSLHEASYYFRRPVHAVVDLLQNTYQGSLSNDPNRQDKPHREVEVGFSVLVLFCELFKIVQEHFLRHVMAGLRIPPNVSGRLFADNRDPRHRAGKLFPTLTGESWSDAVDKISARSGIDYVETARFVKKCLDTRDAFAHASDLSIIGEDAASGCMLRIEQLLELHVALHNRYVPAIRVGRRA